MRDLEQENKLLAERLLSTSVQLNARNEELFDLHEVARSNSQSSDARAPAAGGRERGEALEAGGADEAERLDALAEDSEVDDAGERRKDGGKEEQTMREDSL